MKSLLSFQMALSMVPGIGARNAKNLIAHCGSAEAVFKESRKALLKIGGIGERTIGSLHSQKVMARVDEEITFMDKNEIRALFYLDDSYPKRLKWCDDGPLILYQKGKTDLNNQRMLAMVGSRAANEYGLSFCKSFIADLHCYNPIILSGLAYGIDISAHKAALKENLKTVAVLGNGLDRVYPSIHRRVADNILAEGGSLLSEFTSGTGPDRENFPKRNRIIAGMSEAIVVVQAAIKGGALITAEIANTYNRDVFAVPGRIGDMFSEGCNHLIKTNKAALITGVKDLKYILGWEEVVKDKAAQVSLFPELSEEEQKVYAELMKHKKLGLDDLCFYLKKPVSKILPLLMTMELRGLVCSRPGKVFMAH